jgi:metallo-beta-lactamase class B
MCTRCAFISGVAAFAAAPLAASARTGDPRYLEIATPGMARVADTVWLGQLTPNVWLYTVSKILDEAPGYYPANGAIVVNGDHSIFIDTGWLPYQTVQILDAWKKLGKPPITTALVTHFHVDRLGGIPALQARGIPSYGNPLTIGLAIDTGFAPPKPLHDLEKMPVKFGNVEAFYPGPGHTLDNIVAWIPSDRVLFGGCLIKSTTSHGLGNVADANVAAWPTTMKTLAAQYPNPKHVIPGHGTIHGDPIAHTTTLAIAGKA